MFEIRKYNDADKEVWNAYVEHARNATFLFNRNYMDYHSDRFKDYSLMFYKNGKLHSLLPAHEREEIFCSHFGLTYGGLIMNKDVTAADVVQLFKELNEYLRQQGFKKVLYKPVPWVYHQMPSEEDLYAIYWVCKARIVKRDNRLSSFPTREAQMEKTSPPLPEESTGGRNYCKEREQFRRFLESS